MATQRIRITPAKLAALGAAFDRLATDGITATELYAFMVARNLQEEARSMSEEEPGAGYTASALLSSMREDDMLIPQDDREDIGAAVDAILRKLKA